MLINNLLECLTKINYYTRIKKGNSSILKGNTQIFFYMTDNERLECLGKYIGVSLNKLAFEIGLKTPQRFYDIKSKKHGISKDLARRIKAKYPKINTEWLLTGEGDMLEKEGEDSLSVWTNSMPAVTLIPQYSLDVAGGSENEHNETFGHLVGYTPFTAGRQGDICCPVSGRSMYPSYPPGCIVLLRPIQEWKKFLEMGRVYVIELEDGRRMIKELRKGEAGEIECFILHSYNEQFPDAELPVSLIKRIYLVIAKYENELM